LRKKLQEAVAARSRAERAVERAQMASLEEDYEADMSRRGADTLDMSNRFIRESPTRVQLLRACDLAARRKGLASMLVDELASLSLADNAVPILRAPFFYSILSL